MGTDADDLQRRLAAGEWLRPGDVAQLLNISRSTVDRMLSAKPPLIRWRFKPGIGRHRVCHPDDVRRELDKSQRIGEAE